MTISQIWLILRARWLSGAIVLGIVLLAAALLTLVSPRQYTAAASVVLDVKSPDPIAGSPMQAMAISSYMATQADVLSSERVIVGALKELKYDENPKLKEAWQEDTGGRSDFLSWLSQRILKKFEVLPARESNVVTVTYTSTDPEEAARVANAIVRSYIATTVALRVEPARQYNTFFDERARDLRDALEKAQARLSEYQRDAGVVASDEKMDVENARLSELSTQLVGAQAAASESSARSSIGGAHADSNPDAVNNPVISSLTSELALKRAKLGELTTRYGDRYPDVETMRANVRELESRIGAERARVVGSANVSNSINASKVAQLKQAYEDQRARVLELKVQRDQASVLKRDVENANQAYSAAFARVSQANLESQSTQTNVSILKNATTPAHPSKPRVLLNMAVAFVIGCVLALAVIIVRELRNQRLRSNDDVARFLGQPLFGVLPDVSSRRRRRLSGMPFQRLGNRPPMLGRG